MNDMPDNQPAPKIVICISGGNLQVIQATENMPSVDIVVIDHDNMEAEGIDSDRADELENAACEGCSKVLDWDDHSSVKLEGDPTVWEFTLPGFDASSDATDDKVLWIAGTLEELQAAVGVDFAQRFEDIGDGVDVSDAAIDYHLPDDTAMLLRRLLQAMPAVAA